MMNLPFPGGPVLEERAGRCRSRSAVVRFPRPLLSSSDLNFSFSGLKTAVLYELKRRAGRPLTPQEVDGIARGFQDAVVEVLLTKALEAVRRTRARCLMLAGGVARNRSLRSALQSAAGEHGIRFLCAPERYCTDNGVMVAALAHRNYAAGFRDDLSLDINPGLRLC
jgi:N6-L-threonylcarbamoyladenine synthase